MTLSFILEVDLDVAAESTIVSIVAENGMRQPFPRDWVFGWSLTGEGKTGQGEWDPLSSTMAAIPAAPAPIPAE